MSASSGLSTDMPNIALKGGGDSSGRPKRYSSLRQRSLPETNTYQAQSPPNVPPPHPSYYESGLRMPVNTPPPRLFPQVSVPAPQPLMQPPPCITPAPNMMSFAPAPPPTGYHQYAYQQYAPAPPPPPPPAPPSDMYQTGITYYYPQSQPPSVRPTVQKRPKAAIPILPPPERDGKRNNKKDSSQSPSSNRNFSENSSDSGSVDVSIRTEASSQLQPAVGVES
ncbi:protein CASC3 [Trichonephila clavipes]|nr:protein CASC3 [Trichonephila clavipes]